MSCTCFYHFWSIACLWLPKMGELVHSTHWARAVLWNLLFPGVVCTWKTSCGIVLFNFFALYSYLPSSERCVAGFDVKYKNTKWDSGERLEMNKVSIFGCVYKCSASITWEETLEETKKKKIKTVIPRCSTMTRIHDELPSWVCLWVRTGQPVSECSDRLFRRACMASVKCRLLSSNRRLNPALACFPSCSVFLPSAT